MIVQPTKHRQSFCLAAGSSTALRAPVQGICAAVLIIVGAFSFVAEVAASPLQRTTNTSVSVQAATLETAAESEFAESRSANTSANSSTDYTDNSGPASSQPQSSSSAVGNEYFAQNTASSNQRSVQSSQVQSSTAHSSTTNGSALEENDFAREEFNIKWQGEEYHTNSTQNLPTDSTNVNIRNAELDLDEMRSRPEYSYVQAAPAEESLWDTFWGWFWDLMLHPLTSDGSVTLLELCAYLALLAGVIIVIRSLLGGAFFGFLGRRDRSTDFVYKDGEELDIQEMSLENMLSGALSNRQYRSAVRYRFLMILREMSARQIINWRREKTNSDYLSELKDPELRRRFRHAARLFDHVWYGEWNISAAEEAEIAEVFNQLLAHLGHREAATA